MQKTVRRNQGEERTNYKLYMKILFGSGEGLEGDLFDFNFYVIYIFYKYSYFFIS